MTVVVMCEDLFYYRYHKMNMIAVVSFIISSISDVVKWEFYKDENSVSLSFQ